MFGVNYTIYNRSLSYPEVQSRINNGKPIYAQGRNSSLSMDHAVVIMGYKTFQVTDYIKVWDPASYNGAGGYGTFYMSGNLTTFQTLSSGYVYTWYLSLAS